MKTAIIGASGYIGSRLLSAYRQDYPDSIGTAHNNPQAGLLQFHLNAPDIEPLRLVDTGHECIAIAASMTGIQACESDLSGTSANTTGTLDLIRQAGQAGLEVIYLSSDNVFDGRTGYYSDQSKTNPTMNYGRQKAKIEKEIGNLCERYTVIRLSKIYGLEKRDGTILDEIAAQLAAGHRIKAAHDLIFNPSWIEDIVRTIRALQTKKAYGIINLCAPEPYSRYDLAMRIAHALNVDQKLIDRVAFSELAGPSDRPLNTSMICPRLNQIVDVTFISIHEAIEKAASNWRSPSC